MIYIVIHNTTKRRYTFNCKDEESFLKKARHKLPNFTQDYQYMLLGKKLRAGKLVKGGEHNAKGGGFSTGGI